MGACCSFSNRNRKEGFQVERVLEGSPGHRAGLQAFFDFVMAVDDKQLSPDKEVLKQLLRVHEDKLIVLRVYNIKSQTHRSVKIVPSQDWGGHGLLGISIQYCSFKDANENVVQVLQIDPNSPAELAGLKENTDYIMLFNRNDLSNLFETHDGQTLKLYVYNTETDSCREVTITPNSSWGGRGSTGFEIENGSLQTIPSLPFSNASRISNNGCWKSPKVDVSHDINSMTDGFSEIALTDENIYRLPENTEPSVSTNIVLPGMPPLNAQVGSISVPMDNDFSKDYNPELIFEGKKNLYTLEYKIQSILDKGQVSRNMIKSKTNTSALYWVSNWVEKDFGFGYRLNDGTNVVLFNDSSVMMMRKYPERARFMDSSGNNSIIQVKEMTEDLKNKWETLKQVKNDLNQNVEENITNQTSLRRVPYVMLHILCDQFISFYLTNGTLQINLRNNDMKVILIGDIVTCVKNTVQTFSMNSLEKNGITEALRPFLHRAKEIIKIINNEYLAPTDV